MGVLKGAAVHKALLKKGFITAPGKQKHIRYQFCDGEKRSSVRTHLSHNGQELSDSLQQLMASQIHLSKAEFLAMISCTINHEDLVKKYTDFGLLKK
jgi:hypothetical protein